MNHAQYAANNVTILLYNGDTDTVSNFIAAQSFGRQVASALSLTVISYLIGLIIFLITVNRRPIMGQQLQFEFVQVESRRHSNLVLEELPDRPYQGNWLNLIALIIVEIILGCRPLRWWNTTRSDDANHAQLES